MTTTLTLTPDAGTQSVLITAATNAAGLTLTRADQNGAVPVRLLAGQELGQAVAVRDHEPALVGPVRYTATTTEPVELRRNATRYPRAVAGQWTSSGLSNIPNPDILDEGGDPFARFTRSNGSATGLRCGGFNAAGAALPAGRVYAVLEIRGTAVSSPYVTVRQGSNATNLAVSPSLALTSEWQQVVVPYDVPTAGTGYSIVVVAPNGGAGEVFDVRRAGLIIGGQSYLDGASPGAQWAGSANASESFIRGIETVEQLVRFDEGALEVTADVWSLVERPQFSARGRLTLNQSLSADDRSTKHVIIGRPDPVFTMQRSGFREGTVEVLCLDIGQVESFYALMQQAGIVQVRTAALSPGQRLLGDLYVKLTRVEHSTVDGTAPWRFRVRLNIVEVRRPTGPLLGSAVWTYDGLAGSGLTYDTVPAAFASYNGLAAGVRVDA